MDNLELIKLSLQNNPNIDNSVKEKLYTLVTIFHNKLPQINLTKLS